MEVAAHVDALEDAGARLVEAARAAGPDAAVPTCPGWRMRDLLAHVGFVHRWATAYVRTALTEMVAEPDEAAILRSAPPDEERVAWATEGHAALVQALRAAPPDLECWTFLAAPSPLAMWARRQAHETAVHAVDAALATGHPGAPFDAELAADGVDELLFSFYGRRRPGRAGRHEDAVVGLEATDAPAAWTLRVSADALDARPGPGPCDVHVRGAAHDLYLLLWHRRSAEGLEVSGTAAALDQLVRRRGVTWQ